MPAHTSAADDQVPIRPGADGGGTSPARRAPLSQEFQAAAAALLAVCEGRRLPDAIEAALREGRLPAASRSAVQDFAATATRRLGWAEAIAARLNSRPPPPPIAALQAVVLALWAPSDRPPSPRGDGVVVDQAVRAARSRGGEPAARFLNATLRRFLRERESLDDAIAGDERARWNLPDWWLARLRADHPDDWQAIAAAGDRSAALVLRVNARRTDVAGLVRRLLEAGVTAEPIGDHAVRLGRSTDVTRLPGFAEGWFSVQDPGAQWAAPLLDVRPGQRVLDACAAPGGKTAHVLERSDCELLALDLSEARMARVAENLGRLGLKADLRVGDAAEPAGWWDGRPFDRILVDAPCSASGILRRHPDVRWLRRRGDIATLCRDQRRMLAGLWPLLRPGGKLLYATCSVFRDEGEQIIADFLADRPDARVVSVRREAPALPPSMRPAPGLQLLPGLPAPALRDTASGPQSLAGQARPDIADHDGFYYCLLEQPP